MAKRSKEFRVGAVPFMEALEKAIEVAVPEMRQMMAEYTRRYRRFLTGAAAGGLVLCTTIAAAIVGPDAQGSVPWPLTLATFAFLIAGTIAAIIAVREREELEGQIQELTFLSMRKEFKESEHPDLRAMADTVPKSDENAESIRRTQRRLEWAMIASLSIGVGTSVIVLLHFTAFP